MKKALLVCLLLGGCVSISPEEISSRAKEIQNYTRVACSFVPTVATITAIINQSYGATVASIAQDICTAITTAPLADGGPRVPKVRGVVIKGRKV